MLPETRGDCEALDAVDALAVTRELFSLPADVIYLDGNSLGPLPAATMGRIQDVTAREWGHDLIQSWNKAGWIDRPSLIGDKIARLIGAGPDEVIAVDSTSINLYKVLSVAMMLSLADAPSRRVIISERDNFPTDLYIAESLARQHMFELRLVDADDLPACIDESVAVVLLTHVNYRTGAMHDMGSITATAHRAGALMLWDLAHSAGAVPVNLNDAGADFAVGCGYKYLNGGPGSPAFVWLRADHGRRLDSEQWWQPLSGWMGHAAPFTFDSSYRPAAGIARFACGTPSAIALAALECGVDTVLAAEPLGGMTALRRKSLALSELFIHLIDRHCAGHRLQLQTPRDAAQRGSQVSYLRDRGGYAIVQALVERGVVGDYRDPGILRFGFTPLYLRFVDVWDAVDRLADILKTSVWREERFQRRSIVT